MYGHTSTLERYALRDAMCEVVVQADVVRRTSSQPLCTSVRMVQVVDACWNAEDGSFFAQMYPVLS